MMYMYIVELLVLNMCVYMIDLFIWHFFPSKGEILLEKKTNRITKDLFL